jgi:hypothetical protein
MSHELIARSSGTPSDSRQRPAAPSPRPRSSPWPSKPPVPLCQRGIQGVESRGHPRPRPHPAAPSRLDHPACLSRIGSEPLLGNPQLTCDSQCELDNTGPSSRKRVGPANGALSYCLCRSERYSCIDLGWARHIFADGFQQSFHAEGLGDVSIGTDFGTQFLVELVADSRDHNHGG